MRYPLPGRAASEEAGLHQGLVQCHVRECLHLACLAIKESRKREEFPALMNLILACKDAEEAVEA